VAREGEGERTLEDADVADRDRHGDAEVRKVPAPRL
jgi:hypothetical protein